MKIKKEDMEKLITPLKVLNSPSIKKLQWFRKPFTALKLRVCIWLFDFIFTVVALDLCCSQLLFKYDKRNLISKLRTLVGL